VSVVPLLGRYQHVELVLRRPARFLGHHPLVGAAELEQPGDHGVELGHRHGVVEEEVRDDEREGSGRREDVQERHQGWDVADDPVGELSFRHEHCHREEDAEEREGAELGLNATGAAASYTPRMTPATHTGTAA
jgi:hypothetical protein